MFLKENKQTDHQLSELSVNKYLIFKETYYFRLICYCALLGLGSRPVVATGDKRPAYIVCHSKQFRGEVINYYHNEGNI